jgi:hypothetical protein
MNLQKTILISKANLLSVLAVLLLLIMVDQSKLYAQAPANQPARQRSPTSLYLRAPDTIPGTLPEMRDPSYWIAKMNNPDAVVLSLTEIQIRNKAYIQ